MFENVSTQKTEEILSSGRCKGQEGQRQAEMKQGWWWVQ